MEFLHILEHSLIDTAKLLPLLFAVYYLIELLEYKYALKMQKSKLLNGKASPIFGALMGSVPQCGFSVVSTDLYTRKAISIGALIAVYVATSDEAIPIMLSHPESWKWLLALIAIKIFLGIVIGYIASVLYRLTFKKRAVKESSPADFKDSSDHVKVQIMSTVSLIHDDNHEHGKEGEEDNGEHVGKQGGCCHHHVAAKTFDWKHPLLHCLKIALFILAINIVFTTITELWIGEDRLISFLSSSTYFQPIFAILIGLIPNCVSSVVVTELFLMGGLSFGALVAGLCVNAGIGLIILLKQNKNAKENAFIFGVLIVCSITAGYLINFISSLF